MSNLFQRAMSLNVSDVTVNDNVATTPYLDTPNKPPPSYQFVTQNDSVYALLNSNSVDDTKLLTTTTTTTATSREEIYRDIIRKHEINDDFANRLQQLQGFKVVFVFDDSGSMNTVLQDSPLNSSDSLFKATRWDELQYFAAIAIEIASVFGDETCGGCDVYFLNRTPSPVRNVSHINDLRSHFTLKPNGYTPLARVLKKVLSDNATPSRTERKLLIIIATDGEPTDDKGKVNVGEFKRAMLSRGSNVFTTVVACTDDDESVQYLNRWDRSMINLDVVDDFRNERQEIRKIKGPSFKFSFGDYVVKSLIGSIDEELDKMDEANNCCITQ